MVKVLFVNHKEQRCGVYQFGKRVYQLASRSKNVDYHYCEALNAKEFGAAYNLVQPDVVIYNFYICTMPWLADGIIHTLRQDLYQQCGIYHDGGNIKSAVDKYLFFGVSDRVETEVELPEIVVDIPEDKRLIFPRPLFDYDYESNVDNVIPTIGSFGFGMGHKGFGDLVTMVNNTFDEAVLNIHMSIAAFGDAEGTTNAIVKKQCEEANVNPGIQLNITTDFMSDEDMLYFLARNDINVFLYGVVHPGVSSVIDYALSVRRPIAISACTMFRHIMDKDIVVSETNTLKDIINRGTAPLEKYYEAWSTDKFVEAFDEVWKDAGK